MDINEIWRFDLRKGNSNDPRDGACLLDAVSWFEYGKLGDHPACVCPVIATFGRYINDAISQDNRQRLKVFIPRLIGTVDLENEQLRAEYLAWQAIRVFAPIALDAAGLHKKANQLRTFEGDLKAAAGAAAEAAAEAAEAAAEAAEAAAEAAAGAARAAARAARAAAEAAVGAAAWAAGAAAWAAAEAARAAARAAAWAAAGAAVEDLMIETLDGVLKIGRQANPIEHSRMLLANEKFELARL